MTKQEKTRMLLIVLLVPLFLLTAVNSIFKLDKPTYVATALTDESHFGVKDVEPIDSTPAIVEIEKTQQSEPPETKLNYVDKQNPMKYIVYEEETVDYGSNIIEVISLSEESEVSEPSDISLKEEIPSTPESSQEEVVEAITETAHEFISNVDLDVKSQTVYKEMEKLDYDEQDLLRLANFIDLEADTYDEKLGLASIIVNRVKDKTSTISDVLLEEGQFPHQNLLENHNAAANSYEASIEALNGSAIVEDAMYYYSTEKYDGAWHKENLKELKTIGDLKFFSRKGGSTLAKSEVLTEKEPVIEKQPAVATQPVVEKSKPSEPVKVEETQTRNQTSSIKYSYTEEEFDLLAKLVWAEARGEEYEGKLAVAATVLNRYSKANFSKSIKDIIYAPKQYQPVSEGKLETATPTPADYEAVVEALNGVDPTNGATSFYAPKIVYSAWHESLTHTVTIGSHKFFK